MVFVERAAPIGHHHQHVSRHRSASKASNKSFLFSWHTFSKSSPHHVKRKFRDRKLNYSGVWAFFCVTRPAPADAPTEAPPKRCRLASRKQWYDNNQKKPTVKVLHAPTHQTRRTNNGGASIIYGEGGGDLHVESKNVFTLMYFDPPAPRTFASGSRGKYHSISSSDSSLLY